MTPCEKAGLKVGDKIRILAKPRANGMQVGWVVSLNKDDGEGDPWFDCPDEEQHVWHVNSPKHKWEKIEDKQITQPTSKQEALDQIDSLRAYIEDCDKPKQPRRGSMVRKIQDLEARLNAVYDAGQWGIGHVGMANYAERQAEAEEKLDAAMWGEEEGELPPNDTKES